MILKVNLNESICNSLTRRILLENETFEENINDYVFLISKKGKILKTREKKKDTNIRNHKLRAEKLKETEW